MAAQGEPLCAVHSFPLWGCPHILVRSYILLVPCMLFTSLQRQVQLGKLPW